MTLRIEPFAAGAQQADSDLAAQFTQAAIQRLSQWEILTVSVPGATQPAGALIPRYCLRGTVHADATLATIVVQLTETRTGRLLYTTQIRRPLPASSAAIYGAAVVLLAGFPKHIRDAEFARYDGPPRDATDMVLRASARTDGFGPAHDPASLALGERALALEPDNPAAQYVMATLLYADFLASDARRGNAEGRRALALTDSLLAMHPRNLIERHLRAALLAALGDLRGAQAEAEAALADEPDNSGMLATLSAVLLQEGDVPGALRVLPRGGSGGGDLQAVQAFAQGRYADALEITQRNDAAASPDLFEYVFQAATLARLGRLAEAHAALATSLPLLPSELRHAAALRQALFNLPAPAWALFKDSLAIAGMPS